MAMEGLLEQAASVEGVTHAYFEGGEPMLYYPLVKAGIRKATELGLASGIVTCGYYATTVPDGRMWLEPLREVGLSSVEVSIDRLHGDGEATANARNLVDAARGLGMQVSVLSVCDPREEGCTEAPTTRTGEEPSPVMLRGRAAHDMVEGLEMLPLGQLTDCPLEELESPTRVHVDPYGNVHVCQGIIAGNVWDGSLVQVVRGYSPRQHPVLGPLIEGGPLALAEAGGAGLGRDYASECHACYSIRRELRQNPDYRGTLGPAQVYGEEPEPPPSSYD